ncbi:Hypothetical predicted protein, partial [Marmota monax]
NCRRTGCWDRIGGPRCTHPCGRAQIGHWDVMMSALELEPTGYCGFCTLVAVLFAVCLLSLVTQG